jgi:hypothetical protein
MEKVSPPLAGTAPEGIIPLHLGFQLEQEQSDRSDTWYHSLSPAEYISRKTEPRDVPVLMTFIDKETKLMFPSLDIGKL